MIKAPEVKREDDKNDSINQTANCQLFGQRAGERCILENVPPPLLLVRATWVSRETGQCMYRRGVPGLAFHAPVHQTDERWNEIKSSIQ